MSNETWRLVVDPTVHKALRKFPRKDQEVLTGAIDELALNPHTGDIQKMEGKENAWRRRVRSYRIKYEIYTNTRTVFVYELKRRSSTTY